MNSEIQKIIVRVLEGNSSESENLLLKKWLSESTAHREEFDRIEALWNATSIIENREKFNSSEGFQKFVHSVKTNAEKKSSPLIIFYKVAASIILICLVSYSTFYLTKKNLQEVSFFELVTPNGSHTSITLTDGTQIWLNAGSKLRYPNFFKGKERMVFLEGEAFFHVKKDSLHPFIVKTKDINVKALGTSFNVKAYTGEGTVETTLVTGIVEVTNNNNSSGNKGVRLLPNQKITYIRKEGKLLLNEKEQQAAKLENIANKSDNREKESYLLTRDVNTELYTSWIDNKLVFDSETFESIAFKLERRYGATVIFKNRETKDFRFSGKFPEISIDRVLNALQFASHFNYEIKSDTIIIN